ncbi:hypothetical protein D3C81_1260510 [compost metagenome]
MIEIIKIELDLVFQVARITGWVLGLLQLGQCIEMAQHRLEEIGHLAGAIVFLHGLRHDLGAPGLFFIVCLRKGRTPLVDGKGPAVIVRNGGQLLARQAGKGIGPLPVDKGGSGSGRLCRGRVIRFRHLPGGSRLVFRVERIENLRRIVLHPRTQRRMIVALDGGAGGHRGLRQAPGQGGNHDVVGHGASASRCPGGLRLVRRCLVRCCLAALRDR